MAAGRSEPEVEVRTFRDWSNFIAGRKALVTGSGGGVGRAIAIQMARAGAEVWVNDIHLDRACRAQVETLCRRRASLTDSVEPCFPSRR